MADKQKDMIKAAKHGDLEKARSLLADDAGLLNACDTDGSTPLHGATWKGHVAMVTYLVGAGADVNVHNRNDHWGTTPLHAAANANQSAIVQLLIEHGADVNARDLNGMTPLHHTTSHKAKVLQSHGAE